LAEKIIEMSFTHRDIIRQLKECNFPDTPIAIISSVHLPLETTFLYSDKNFQAGIVSDAKELVSFWQIKNNTVDRWREITRTAAALGAEKILFIGKGFAPNGQDGSQVHIITDHINVSGKNPLIGPNDESFGTRFPDMTSLYNVELNSILKSCSDDAGLFCRESICLIPKNPLKLSKLEKKIIDLRSDIVVSEGVFAGAITAKHMSLHSTGLIVDKTLSGQNFNKLLKNILCRI
jgi:hypothetical protein